MSNYGKCKYCEYGEPPDSGWKWYCTWYKTYEDPDELQDCSHFKKTAPAPTAAAAAS